MKIDFFPENFPYKFTKVAVLVGIICILFLNIFAGVGWGFLFIALSHLLLTVPFSRKKLIKLIEGKDFYVTTLSFKTIRGIFVWVIIILINVVLFYSAYLLLKVNIRVIDIFL